MLLSTWGQWAGYLPRYGEHWTQSRRACTWALTSLWPSRCPSGLSHPTKGGTAFCHPGVCAQKQVWGLSGHRSAGGDLHKLLGVMRNELGAQPYPPAPWAKSPDLSVLLPETNPEMRI